MILREAARPGTREPAWPLAWFLIPFIILSTLNSGGYRYGASDLAFYVPAALERINPALFPRDAPLIAAQARLTGFDEVIAAPLPDHAGAVAGDARRAVRRHAGAPGPALWLLGSRLYRSPWATAALMMALTLRHAVSRSGTNTLEGYFHPRQLAFSLGALALVGVPDRRRLLVIALLSRRGFCTRRPHSGSRSGSASRPLSKTDGAGCRSGSSRPQVGRLACGARCRSARRAAVVMDPEWLATLSTKDYLFPLAWPVRRLVVNLAYAPLIVWLYKRRLAAGAVCPGERGLVFGCLSLLSSSLVLPFNHARVALAVQLQTPRIFWMLDFLRRSMRCGGSRKAWRRYRAAPG